MTAGGCIDIGRCRNGVAGEGDGGFAEAVRGGRNETSSTSVVLPLAFSLRVPPPICDLGLNISFAPPLPTMPPAGCGECALVPGALLGLELAICSKCDRREDTGFCISNDQPEFMNQGHRDH